MKRPLQPTSSQSSRLHEEVERAFLEKWFEVRARWQELSPARAFCPSWSSTPKFKDQFRVEEKQGM